ncbi:transporter substrate-binding domain-containing protein [Cupriavidus basilensis]|uniref:histidine kinase n=1 Tax=Cupriavidus basilensis TaxID=68895 RepID=A0ABT6ATR5_9BURK|nr:transporter substrate-binding domain-containing protein [Cupriavidus basilensis]MDF3836012.1 transporter substrate-binding domain-containing protein [Cupriavidus basilensis]
MCFSTCRRRPADRLPMARPRMPAATRWRHQLALLLALCHGVPPQAAIPAEPRHRLTLSSQVQPDSSGQPGADCAGDAELDAWRRGRKVLRVGVVGNYLPPFDLVDLKGNYRGISADYLAVVAARLGVPAQIRGYASHEAARRALADGAIDLITTDLDRHGGGIRTAPYHEHRLIEVVSGKDDARNNAGRTVGYLKGEVAPGLLRHAYPEAQLQPFENLLGALDQLARNADFVVVTNATAAGYLIEQYRYGELASRNVAPLPQDGIAFTVGDPALGRIVDRTLAAMPATLKREIETFWTSSSLEFDITGKLDLSAAERSWIASHPEVRYLVAHDLIPFQFLDAQQRLDGLTEQVLQLIGQRTGLRFVPYWPSSKAQTKADLENGTLDVLPVLPLNHAATSEGLLSVSAPYFSGNWVVVTRAGDDSIKSVPDLADKLLASPPFDGVHDLVRASQAVSQRETATYAEAFRMVAAGRADAIISNASMAGYMLERTYGGRLKIAAPASGLPLEIGLGVSNRHPELLAIIDKAILSIARDDLGAMRAHWTEIRPQAAAWRQFLPWLTAGTATLLLVSLLFIAWVTSLRRQVTQRAAAERALQDQVSFQTAVLDGIPQPIYLRDSRFRMITCNTAFEAALDTTRGALAGTDPAFVRGAVKADISHDDLLAVYRHVLDTGQPFSAARRLTIAGEARNVIGWVVPLQRADGGPAGIVGGWIDVTEHQRMLAELAAAKSRAEAANRAKSTFLASISHEIRTPMNAILGMLELARTRAHVAHGDRELLDTAHGAATSLLSLLDDILDLSKMEAGKFTLQPRAASLRQALHEVAQMFGPVASQKGLAMKVSVGETVAQAHRLDILRIKQVVGNFVSNAIRFTERGGVDIRLDETGMRGTRQSLDLVISDTGIGIPAEAIGALFRPFTQVDSPGRMHAGGTGLGLSIAQSLVRKMGGEVTLESRPGQGTQVLVRLSFDLAAPPPQAGVSTDGTAGVTLFPPGIRVLVVDDHAPNRLLLARQLERLGIAVDAAVDGEQGLRNLQSRPPDLVICDCMMPVMDGFSLARAIRARRDDLRSIPVIGCTASAQNEDHRQALAAGMNDVLVKPVGLAMLERTLRKHLHGARAAPGDAASA